MQYNVGPSLLSNIGPTVPNFMLGATLKFKIRPDLLCNIVPIFSQGLNLTWVTYGFLGYFLPGFFESAFEPLNWIKGWSTSICFQIGPNTNVYWRQVWWWGWPNFLAPGMRKTVLAPPRAMKLTDSCMFITHTSKLR